MFVRGHGLTQQLSVDENEFVIDVSDYEETSELIVASDLLITDYSSIMFDYALLEKPIFIYAPDYDKYVEERGVYFDINKTGLEIFDNDYDLLLYIHNHNEVVEAEKARQFGVNFIQTRVPNSTPQIDSYMKEQLTLKQVLEGR